MSKDDSTKGKIVLSKRAAFAIGVLVILVIVAVGLLAGLLGKPAPEKCTVVSDTTAPNPSKSTTPNTPAETSGSPDQPWANIRLPSSLIPYHYTVDLQPDLKPDDEGLHWFNGNSTAYFSVAQSTNFIVIHSFKLNYTSVSAANTEGLAVSIVTYWTYDPNEYLVVEVDKPLSVGENYTLSTVFLGPLANDLRGLYLSRYAGTDRKEIPIAVSQMQPTDARKSFPCFDEPGLKATFSISLWHEPPYYALSNMPALSTDLVYGSWYRTRFETTFPMSTYLLGFVVCDFNYTEAYTSSEPKIQTRIYARPESVSLGNVDYARNATPYILDYYAEYFNVSYPLPKSDQMAIPDFALGGMENWGLVMYRETALLFDPDINSIRNKQRVLAVIAHELSHQWFGNLISPLWWDEVWLNEGFASYVEYLGQDKVDPEFRVMDQYILLDMHTAFTVDALVTSRPIVAENVNTPSDINALFDDISYEKAGCIIRMINRMTGEVAFRLGLKQYLEEYAYGSVTHELLFKYWEKAVEEIGGPGNPPGGFAEAMNTWVLQMGYPVINVRQDPDNPKNMKLSQERFLLDPEADITKPDSPYGYEWVVPFWFTNELGENLQWILGGGEITVNMGGDYIIGNSGAFGYYRVNYDSNIWGRITNVLNTDYEKINVKNRAQLIDDAFNLARAKRLDYETALDLTPFLRNDLDYITWESALEALSYFDDMLGRSKAYGVYSDYLLYLIQPLYDNVTWTDTGNYLHKYQRVNAISTACSYGNEDCISKAASQFQLFRTAAEINPISSNLRSTVYCSGISNGDSNDWDFLWQKYLNESNSQEKAALEYGLTCVRTPWIIQRLLEFTINDDYVKKQDATGIFQDLCRNEYARDQTWDFIRKEWDFIFQTYGIGLSSFNGLIESCTSHFSTEFELAELKAFKENNLEILGSGLTAVNQALERTNTNIKWKADNEDVIFKWLTETVTNV
ncbi:aminopeptidase N-like [Clavelina lepadiformis]|uniref:aminopeptidase N-like n=1 Tax=Clavelina lepadiformis TaxID=159417 RepID=UPI0040426958